MELTCPTHRLQHFRQGIQTTAPMGVPRSKDINFNPQCFHSVNAELIPALCASNVHGCMFRKEVKRKEVFPHLFTSCHTNIQPQTQGESQCKQGHRAHKEGDVCLPPSIHYYVTGFIDQLRCSESPALGRRVEKEFKRCLTKAVRGGILRCPQDSIRHYTRLVITADVNKW